ncbi:MAG: ADP-ribosylglycohydrolase family protein [Deltaproteobacteria bacterium]|nr:ADP-ribosylglycohydrolase family protein [Deltaproteobacteria bacterium]
MSCSSDPNARLARALRSLDGLSVGDAFGERFFGNDGRERALARDLPAGTWRTTDDTEMAVAIVDVLERAQRIDADRLARAFAARFGFDSARGYGAGAYQLLSGLRMGVPWRIASESLFDGQGSHGNGAAMRVAPLGAYFADDLDAVVREAQRSAHVTHAHPDGAAGAIAVAVAAAWVANPELQRVPMLELAIARTPAGDTRHGLFRAQSLPASSSAELAASVLGSGQEVLSSDTVPFVLWAASRHVGEFEEAMWNTLSGLGDRDTTCAMVGGILATGTTVPSAWLARREPLRRDPSV